MNNRNVVLLFLQFVAETVGDHNRAMSASSTTDPDRQVRLPFTLVKRKQIFQNVRETLDGLMNFLMLIKKLSDLRMIAGEILQRSVKIGIREMAYIKKQI